MHARLTAVGRPDGAGPSSQCVELRHQERVACIAVLSLLMVPLHCLQAPVAFARTAGPRTNTHATTHVLMNIDRGHNKPPSISRAVGFPIQARAPRPSSQPRGKHSPPILTGSAHPSSIAASSPHAVARGIGRAGPPNGAISRADTSLRSPLLAGGAVPSNESPAEVLIVLRNTGNVALETELGREFHIDRQEGLNSALLGLRIVRYRLLENRSLGEMLARLAVDSRVVWAQPSYVYRLAEGAVSSATKLQQYAITKLFIVEAHGLARGRSVRVAVVDTGVDASHPELNGTVVGAYDALGGGRGIGERHGTVIAGVIAARQQLTGVAPEAELLAIRAFGASQGAPAQSTTMVLIKAIEWAFVNGARLLNMSFVGPKDPLLEKLIQTATSRGGIFIAAAGNDGPVAAPAYPAAYESVIAVTATDSNDRIYVQANRGSYIAIAAPGVDILAAAPEAGYELASGTSLAAAHVSGIVALLLERHPGLSEQQVRVILCATARNLDQKHGGGCFGAGLVNALEAVKALPVGPDQFTLSSRAPLAAACSSSAPQVWQSQIFDALGQRKNELYRSAAPRECVP